MPNGNHTIEVYLGGYYIAFPPKEPAGFIFVMGDSSAAFFTVDTTPPLISALSVENKTYGSSSIPLDFTVNELSTLEYCLDGQPNVTIVGNTTLTGLSQGTHTILVFANDTNGNVGSSGPTQFTVNTSTPSSPPSPSPSPISTAQQQSGFLGSSLPWEYGYALVAVVVILAVAAVVLVFRKRSLQSR